MLLLFDIGNTTITIGLYRNDICKHSWKINTYTQRTADEYTVIVEAYLQKKGYTFSDIEDVLISSVVPQLEQTLKWFCENNDLGQPFIVSPSVKSTIHNKLENPNEIGSDLLTAACAAYKKYPSTTSLVVDFGTATTIMVVTENGDFLGGAIAPGIESSLQSLINNTALLTMPDAGESSIHAIGNSTVSALQSGISFGYIGLVDNLIENILIELDTDNYKILSTGGQAQFISKKSKYDFIFEEHLIFDGLVQLYELNK